jgi:ferritin-like metal-binding protein YciE
MADRAIATGNSSEVISRYLQDAIAAESSFETQLRGFATEGDDEEVRMLFATHAEETKLQCHRLTVRLGEMGGSPSSAKSFMAHVFSLSAKTMQATHIPDERVVQNLIIAYSVENSECAMYEALASVAQAAGDTVTETLAREIQSEERQTADKIWRFIPSRAKVAFNAVTAGEVDPAVVTRAAENRILD